MYLINHIQNIDQISQCPLFLINNYQWSGHYRPKTFGQMAILDDKEVFITMTSFESNPLRNFIKNDDPVYKDSALEAFLNFNPTVRKEYLNFEMNANAALLSGFGENRNRSLLSVISQHHAICDAEIAKDYWKVCLRIPMELICDVYQREELQKGDIITCNFYKICEDPEIEHYASYGLIDSQMPDFHLSDFFQKAIIK